MPIIPALSQEVYKYDDTTLVGRSNTFIGFPISYNTFYRIFGALPFGIDIVDVDFSFKWDTTAQTITIESTDVDFDLQGSTLLFNPYTNDTDVCVINIGLGDTQPTELNKAVFRYTVEAGVVSPWTQLRFAIIERKGQVKSNPADPRELCNDKACLVSTRYNMIGTTYYGGPTAYTTTSEAQIYDWAVASIGLASFSPTYRLYGTDKVTLNTTGGTGQTARDNLCAKRTCTMGGADAILDGQFRYRSYVHNFEGAVAKAVTRDSFGGYSYPSDLTLIRGSLPLKDVALSSVNGFVCAMSLGGSCYAISRPTGGGQRAVSTFWEITLTRCFLERYSSPDFSSAPATSLLFGRYRSGGNAGVWEGLDQSEVNALGMKQIVTFSPTRSNEDGVLPNWTGWNTNKNYNSIPANTNFFDAYYDLQQCEVLANKGNFIGMTSVATTNPAVYNFGASVNPALMSDLSKAKVYALSVSTVTNAPYSAQLGALVAPAANTINCSFYSNVNSLVQSISYTPIVELVIMLQQYDDDGNLLPY